MDADRRRHVLRKRVIMEFASACVLVYDCNVAQHQFYGVNA